MLGNLTLIQGNPIRCNTNIDVIKDGNIVRVVDSTTELTVKTVFFTELNGQENVFFTVEELPNIFSSTLPGLEDRYPMDEEVIIDYFYGEIDEDKDI